MSRRFFLFFDVFFRAGRHNKELWDTAVERNDGKNKISFGTCIFEAHVRTTIQENYFTWMYQTLSNPKIIRSKKEALENFKTEYDFDGDLPDKLACGCKGCSDLPLGCEIVFNDETKKYESITDPSKVAEHQFQQRVKIQEIVDANKHKHQKTLELLREKVRSARSSERNNEDSGVDDDPTSGSETEKSDPRAVERIKRRRINLDAKQTFKKFQEMNDSSSPDKENVVTPIRKRQRKMTPAKKKCRVSDEKLDVFKSITASILKEKQSGLRTAWEDVYKAVMNKHILCTLEEVPPVVHRAEEFLTELDELNNDWKNDHEEMPFQPTIVQEM